MNKLREFEVQIKGGSKTMGIKLDIEDDLKHLERIRKIMKDNPVFIKEELSWIENRIHELKDILISLDE